MDFGASQVMRANMKGQMALGDFARVACEADKRSRQFGASTSINSTGPGQAPPHIVMAGPNPHSNFGGWVVARPEPYGHGTGRESATMGFPSLGSGVAAPPGLSLPVHSMAMATNVTVSDSSTNWKKTMLLDNAIKQSMKNGVRAGKSRTKRAPAKSLSVEIPAHCQGEGELGWHPALLDMSTIELNDWINKSRMDIDQVKALKALRRRIKNRRYTQKARERKRTTSEDGDSDDEGGRHVETRSFGVQCTLITGDPITFMEDN
eukprot:m.50403 g.50403  ORF g.50403 m.50403 type:complete len:263 (-) comp7234_c0_seq4:1682-2470(-)